MLEVNPRLTPAEVKDILTATARPMPNYPREPQGYGVVRATAAVEAALDDTVPERELIILDAEESGESGESGESEETVESEESAEAASVEIAPEQTESAEQ
jgi:hypothetical protein